MNKLNQTKSAIFSILVLGISFFSVLKQNRHHSQELE
jgi:hypothetical protein